MVNTFKILYTQLYIHTYIFIYNTQPEVGIIYFVFIYYEMFRIENPSSDIHQVKKYNK